MARTKAGQGGCSSCEYRVELWSCTINCFNDCFEQSVGWMALFKAYWMYVHVMSCCTFDTLLCRWPRRCIAGWWAYAPAITAG